MIKTSKIKRIIAFLMLIILFLSTAQPIFAASGTGTWAGGQYGSNMKTTDNAGSAYGVLIRYLVNTNTGEKKTVFCAEHGIDFATSVAYNGEYYTPTNSTIRKACKVAYVGWYSKYGDYTVDGGILAESMIDVKKAYIYTQQYIWEVLGQSSATFLNSTYQAEYESYKRGIENDIASIERKPSFDGTTITIQAGESKTISDSNGVFSKYESINKTQEGITFKHNKGENTFTISVDENTNLENYRISDDTFKSWGLIREDTQDNDTMIYFEFREGVQNQLYCMHYNDPVSLRMSLNIELFGKLELQKLNQNGDLVDGAIYKVSGPNDYNKEVRVTNGKITLEKLKKGTYTIREIDAPDGYLIDSNAYDVEVKVNKTATKAIINKEPTGKILVYKVNTNNDKVGQAQFQVIANEKIMNKAKTITYYQAGDVVATITSDLNTGIAQIDNLPLGKYLVKEIQAPNGYLLNHTTYNANLQYVNETTPVIEIKIEDVKNTEPTGELKMIKTDRDTGNAARVDGTGHHGDASLNGAVYTLYAKADIYNVARTIKYFSKDDVVGTYTFNEFGKATARITNDNTPARLSIENDIIKGLPMGSYYVRETRVPTGYMEDTNTYNYDFRYKDQNTSVIGITGTATEIVKRAKFEVIKVSTNDNSTATKIANAEFTAILNKYVEYYGSFENAKEHLSEFADDEYSIFRTNENGHGVSNLLAYGEYMVKETFTPSDEIETVIPFYINIDRNSNGVIKEYVENDLPFESYLKMIKIDKKTGKEVTFSNTTFSLYRLNDNNEWERVKCKTGIFYTDKWKTDRTGLAVTEDKLPSGTYKIDEIKLPTGFLVLDEDVTFKINRSNRTLEFDEDYDAYITIKVGNEQPTGTLKVDKSIALKENVDTSLVDVSDLSKIEFTLTAKEKIIDYADGSTIYEKGAKVGNYKLTKDGKLEIKNLPMGKYELKEIKTLDGLVLNDEPIEVEFKKKDDTTKVYTEIRKVENKPTEIEISKTTITGDKELEGAKLSVIDENGNVIDEWTSTKETHKIEGLLVDKTYTLREEIAPDGFVKATDITFTIQNTGDVQKVTMIDKVVKMSKVDVGGKEIEGAKIQVIDKDGNIVDEWTSDKEEHIIKNLVENETYILHEEVSADGFVKATDIEFKVTEDKETQHEKLIDKIVTMSKEDIGGKEIEGAKIQVIDKDGNIVDEWTSGKEKHNIKNLVEGEKYTLHEDVVVGEYVKATDIEFEVTVEKENQHIVMIDKLVEVTKTDLTTGEEIEGAELQVVDEDGNIIDEWTSTKESHKVKGLEEGKTYKLIEKTAPYGYYQTEEIEFVVTTDKETQKVEMKDAPILKNVKVIKVDAETKETIKDKFTFAIYEDIECTKLIKEIKSNNEDGTAIFEELRYGTYYLKETKAPSGYELSDKVVKVEINDKGIFVDDVQVEEKDNTIEFTFENKKIEVPKTGDESNIKLIGGIAILSILGIAYIVIRNHNKNKEN